MWLGRPFALHMCKNPLAKYSSWYLNIPRPQPPVCSVCVFDDFVFGDPNIRAADEKLLKITPA